MTDPFSVLGIKADASEAEVRQRYLELVREFSPDRAPERFAEIRSAYDQIRDPVARLEAQLFQASTQDSIDALLADVARLLVQRSRGLPTDKLLKLAEQT